jgi:hypothetical protein
MRYYAAASAVIPAIAVLVWNGRLWVNIIFIIWITTTAALWIKEERIAQRIRADRTLLSLQTSALRTLSHHRHDWMNDLQVLYGYIRMGKPDKTVQSVERIIERMTQESKIAKLGIPSLILFFQSFRTVTNSVQLEVIVEGEVDLTKHPVEGEAVAETVIDLVHAYRMAAKPGMGDAAKLKVELTGRACELLVFIRYEGDLNDSEALSNKISTRLKSSPLQQVSLEPDVKTLALKAEFRN